MIRFVKFAAIVGVLAIGLVFAAESRAAIYTITPSDATYPTSDGAWAALGTDPTTTDGVQQQDKLWTFGSSTLWDPSTSVQFSMYTGGGQDHHKLVFGGDDNVGSGTYTLNYTIQINQLPATGFLSAQLGVDVNTGSTPTTVTESLYHSDGTTLYGTMTSVDGLAQSTVAINGATFVVVKETMVVGDGANLSGVSNTFVETIETPPSVPEPSTLIVWSLLGGLGLTVGWLRRNRTA